MPDLAAIDLIQGLAGLAIVGIACAWAVSFMVVGIVTKAGTDISEVFPRGRDHLAAGLILWAPVAVVAGMFVAAIGRAL